jgi:hypothetical protein
LLTQQIASRRVLVVNRQNRLEALIGASLAAAQRLATLDQGDVLAVVWH